MLAEEIIEQFSNHDVMSMLYQVHLSYFVSVVIFKNFFIVVQLQLSLVFPHYSPLPYPPPKSYIQSSPDPLSLSLGPLYIFLALTLPLLSPTKALRAPFWSLSVCSLFPCLWFYFAHLFVLLIRFHL